MFDKNYHFMISTCISYMILTMATCSPHFPWFLGQKWKWRCSDLGLFRIHPRAPPPPGGFSKFILVADKLFLKISSIGRAIPTLTTSPPFPWFLGRKWKQRCANLWLFWIQTHAPPPVSGFPKSIFVAENPRLSPPSSRSYWRPLQELSTTAYHCNFVGSFFAYASLTSSENWTTTGNSSRNKMLI